MRKIRPIKSTFFIFILSVVCSISNGQNFSELLPKKGLFISTNKLNKFEIDFFDIKDGNVLEIKMTDKANESLQF